MILNSRQNQKLSGQVLIIVLIVLMVMAITIVGITNSIVRDTQESIQNTDYETLYSASESQVLGIAQNIPLVSTMTPTEKQNAINTYLFSLGYMKEDGYSTICEVQSDNSILCDFKEFGQSTRSTLKLDDKPYIDEAMLRRNENIVFRINPDAGNIPDTITVNLSASDNSNTVADLAIEVILDYRASNGTNTFYGSLVGVYQNNTNNNPFNALDNSSAISFGNANPLDLNSFNFSISAAITTISAKKYIPTATPPYTIKPVGIRFRLISNPTPESVLISVTADQYQDIVQSRTIEATNYKVNEDLEQYGSQAFVKGTIPAYKAPAVFDYTLRTVQ